MDALTRTERPVLRRSFGTYLAVIGAAAAILRVWYATAIPGELGGDAFFYHGLGNAIGTGFGYVDPYVLRSRGDVVATAFRLPVLPGFLGLVAALGGTSIAVQRVVTCVFGIATIVAAGFLGRRVGGERAGLMVAGLAAIYPNLWMLDGLLTVEGLYALEVALLLLVTYQWIDRPGIRPTLLMGILLGVATLTRAEAVLWLLVVTVPVVLTTRSVSVRRRLTAIVVVVGITLAVISPWLVYNAVRFDRPVLLSTNSGTELAAANCREAYSGDLVGSWDLKCSYIKTSGDESQRAADASSAGLQFATDHLVEVPRVVYFRLLRVWDAYHPSQNLEASALIDGRDLTIGEIGQYVYFAAIPLASWGVVVLRRRRIRVYPLLATAILVCIVAAVSHGEIRFRIPAEVGMVVLAGVALTDLGDRWATRVRGRRHTAPITEPES